MVQKLLTVGLTGPTGAGKSTISELSEQFAFDWLDCDRIAREIVLPGQPALEGLAEHFGSDIILPDGSLDRALLAKRAFPTEEGRAALNSLTHPYVAERLTAQAAQAHEKGHHVIIDAPLLFESGADAFCDATIAVLAPVQSRLRRIMERDGISRSDAMLRINAQKPDDYYFSRSGYTIYNNGSYEKFLSDAEKILKVIFGISQA